MSKSFDLSKAEFSAFSLTPEEEQRLNNLSGILCPSCQREMTIGELEYVGYCHSCFITACGNPD